MRVRQSSAAPCQDVSGGTGGRAWRWDVQQARRQLVAGHADRDGALVEEAAVVHIVERLLERQASVPGHVDVAVQGARSVLRHRDVGAAWAITARGHGQTGTVGCRLGEPTGPRTDCEDKAGRRLGRVDAMVGLRSERVGLPEEDERVVGVVLLAETSDAQQTCACGCVYAHARVRMGHAHAFVPDPAASSFTRPSSAAVVRTGDHAPARFHEMNERAGLFAAVALITVAIKVLSTELTGLTSNAGG